MRCGDIKFSVERHGSRFRLRVEAFRVPVALETWISADDLKSAGVWLAEEARRRDEPGGTNEQQKGA
jgi:hypothetical protein